MELVSVGRVRATHGRRGEVTVTPEARDARRFEMLRRVFVEHPDAPPTQHRVLRAWQHLGSVVLQLEGLVDLDQAEAMVGRRLLVPESEAVKLGPGEYFVHDLIGLQVVCDSGRELGRLEEVLPGPANDVYVVKGPYGELLVPAIGLVVLDVDQRSRRMLVHDLPGMVDPDEPL
jgi:16S rRNA processing protein RimM